MAELITERIQPCLLDRLTDEDPDNQKESKTARVISLPRYREGVLRDLRWLLNASAHVSEAEAQQFGEVGRSVLNYGTGDYCGKLASSLDFAVAEHAMMETIKFFEPRILPNTLSVKAVGESQHVGPNTISFEIRGDLWASPIPEQLYIKTQIDLDTGECTL
jgi:type VI secretion system protein ImpF